jgi:hypothetical protein
MTGVTGADTLAGGVRRRRCPQAQRAGRSTICAPWVIELAESAVAAGSGLIAVAWANGRREPAGVNEEHLQRYTLMTRPGEIPATLRGLLGQRSSPSPMGEKIESRE